MAEISSQRSTSPCAPVGVPLTTGALTEFDHMKCIICQQPGDKSTKLTQPKKAGQDSMKRAASIRKDVVSKRLRGAEEEGTPYVYHNTNKCFKWYTHRQKLEAIEQSKVVGQNEMEVTENESVKPMLRRSSVTPREAASSEKDPKELKCVVCGSDRVQVNRVSLRNKYRISERTAAENFLIATKHLKDEVFCRVAELNSVEDVFASDVYCHSVCIRRYLHKHEQDVQSSSSTGNPVEKCKATSEVKHTLFLQAFEHIEPLLQKGYGFTVKDIASFMYHLDDNVDLIVYNRDVKKLLVDHCGDHIQFAPNPRQNESELVFSSNITAADLAVKIKNLDVVKQVGETLNKAAKQVDYGLDDRFCDAEELRHSWENNPMPDEWLTFFSALYSIPKSLMAKMKMMQMPTEEEDADCDDGDDDEDTLPEEENSWAVKNHHSQLNCHFQVAYNHIHHGRRRTPLHTMLGQYIYGKTRSKALLTTLNRVGISTSYNEVKRSRNLMCAYTVQSSAANGVPIPSHFSDEGWAFGAFDNEDFEDNSSLSGTHSKHYTAQVLYQETTAPSMSKPSVSSTNLSKYSHPLKEKLHCQVVPAYHKPMVKPTLPPNFKLVEDIHVDILSDAEEAVQQSANTEFLISLVRCGLPHSRPAPGELPPWSGIHALITTANVPLMRVGFLPVIPSPVTEYATVRKALTNFQTSRQQLKQDTMPVVCDEGVYQIVVDIVMSEPGTFDDLFPMLGMFHFAKVLLRCAGRYLTGSGMEDALIESEVFGPKTVSAVLSGGHYVRSLKGMLIVSEVIDSLMWSAFWHSTDHTSVPFVQSATDLMNVLKTKNRMECVPKFEQVSTAAANLRQQFNAFAQECQEKSELCQYFMNFQKIVAVIKQLITADRDGNWPLHVGTVKASMGILREFDAINYLRYASWYLERIQVLEVTYPSLYRRFRMGHFVVKDRIGAVFAAVAGDLKLEQSQNRFSQGPGGHVIVGSAGDAAVVAEFALLFHEILAISNLLQLLTNVRLMDHLETSIQHELGGRKGIIFDRNVARLLDFVNARENPFLVLAPNVPLHNFVTKQIVKDNFKARILKALENGDTAYQQFRKERYVDKSKKLSVTISKVKLPAFDSQCSPEKANTNTESVKATVSMKDIAFAQKEAEIATLRGISPRELYAHDLLQSSPLFVGEITTKPDKAQLTAELEKNLQPVDYQFNRENPLTTHVVLDFMSKIRQLPNLRSTFTNFGEVIQEVFQSANRVCPSVGITHIVFDSYRELSIKEGERIRRAGEHSAIELAVVDESVPIPHQMDKFWASSVNKQNLQLLARDVGERDLQDVVLSGMVVNEELISARLKLNGSPASDLSLLNNWQEEADCRIINHVHWAVRRGCKRVVVMSNDTDTVILLLHYIDVFKEGGLQELWVQFGTGEKRRMIPLHVLHLKLGEDLCHVLIKAHVMTGDDALSKIGTKHAALTCRPTRFLSFFGETPVLSEADLYQAEQYLVNVWAGARSKPTATTFDQLRLEVHRHSLVGIEELPPTSSVIRGHLKRAFYVIRNALTLIADASQLDPTHYGWINQDGTLLPLKCLKPIPARIRTLCNCSGKCNSKRCSCKAADVMCVIYCHKKVVEPICTNK